MAGSVLHSFVSGTRQVLTAQLFVSVAAVGLAGWTLGVTNELIRERDRLRERVIQLEEDMGSRGIVVPSTPTVVETEPPPAETVYPGEVGLGQDGSAPADGGQDVIDAPPADPNAAPEPAPAPETPTRAGERTFNPGQIFTELFAPAPPLRILVLHARGERDGEYARRLAGELTKESPDLRVIIDVIGPRDQRESGYAYFDGRQSRAAAALVAQFNDLSRRYEIAPWSAQLRGVALPAQGEYTADRLDIVLPPLPEPNLQLNRVDPRLLQREAERPRVD
jgi:hypothetical protein